MWVRQNHPTRGYVGCLCWESSHTTKQPPPKQGLVRRVAPKISQKQVAGKVRPIIPKDLARYTGKRYLDRTKGAGWRSDSPKRVTVDHLSIITG